MERAAWGSTLQLYLCSCRAQQILFKKHVAACLFLAAAVQFTKGGHTTTLVQVMLLAASGTPQCLVYSNTEMSTRVLAAVKLLPPGVQLKIHTGYNIITTRCIIVCVVGNRACRGPRGPTTLRIIL